jgi:branched-chain amino acid transport system substrate-binding protein
MMSSRISRGRKALTVALAAGVIATMAACATTEPDPGATSDVEGSVLEFTGADTDNLGGDLTINVGLDVALSGQGAYYGDVMVKGAQLAADQIAAAGGPTFVLSVKDHKSGDAQAGVQTTREFSQEGVHMALYSYIAVLGSALQPIEQYKILSLDGGGGTQEFAKGMPYFYGTRALPPNDTFAGTAQYIAAALPDVTKVALIIGDTGAENTADSVAKAEAELTENGIELVDTEVVIYGGNDFTSAVNKILATDAQLIISAQYGTDGGYLLKQLRAAGSDLPVIGTDFIPDVAEIAGPEIGDFSFSLDYFDAAQPSNQWAQYLVDTAGEAYPDLTVDFYFANYYQDMFKLWAVVQRVLAEGGDVNNPDDLLAAFESDLTFASVYGGTPDELAGTESIDPESHSLSSRDMGVFRYDNGEVTRLASYGIGGTGFTLTE